MTSPTYTHELQIALQAVHLASLLTKSHLLNHLASRSTTTTTNKPDPGVTASTKSDKSEVTTADFASQAVIISIIHHAFPGDSFIAEESADMLRGMDDDSVDLRRRVWELLGSAIGVRDRYGEDTTRDGEEVGVKLPGSVEEMIEVIELGQMGGKVERNGSGSASGRTWILDPIDGTKTYIRGQQYAVCLCLVEHGEQQVAVLGCPNLDIETRDRDGRVKIEEGIVDLRGDGGWIVNCVKGRGVGLSRMCEPDQVRPLDEVIAWDGRIRDADAATDEKTTNGNGDNTEQTSTSQSPPTIYFTDSAASPHISKPLHQKIFNHFHPTLTPALPLDIWSMQLKFVLLTLRASNADALIRIPPDPDYHASVWDHAGGQLLVRESGGVLTDANGKVFVLGGGMRRLERNWGVCAVRGGGWARRMESGREVHGVVLGRVRGEVSRRIEEEGR